MNIYIETFGCTFNQADSQIMAGLLQEKGWKIVSSPENADAVILNTCYVKHPTEQKVKNRIQSIQNQFPDKKLIISGCMVEIDQKKLKKLAPGAGWIGPHKIKSTPDVVESILNGENIRITGYDNDLKVCLPKIRSNPLIHIIQICEGCDGNCSYCCTRFARGTLQSYPPNLLRLEARKAVSEGCMEIQLTAQDTAAYGKDTGNSLSNFINEVTNIKGDFRVRVGMMHPKSMMDDVDGIINAFKNPKVYKFLHIPIQSGNNGVLDDMNRGHTVDEFKTIITKFKEKIPDISIATDVIVGYPTEDENAFKDTLQVIKEIRPDFLHISKYKHRPGTRASLLNEIDHKSLKKRSKKLNELKSDIAYGKNLELVGSIKNVLITEKGSKGGYVGRTDSYKTVVVEDAPIGSFLDVLIVDAKSTYLRGTVQSFFINKKS
ncbi:MAG TPA: tRNA (N(6)-L-threonylcarbamoyladenosine(37)-C(2))-methylthiotransferase [Methanobacterium sp.]